MTEEITGKKHSSFLYRPLHNRELIGQLTTRIEKSIERKDFTRVI